MFSIQRKELFRLNYNMIIRILPMSALKGQQDDSPGQRPGYVDGDSRPERAKDLRLQYDNSLFVNLLPLQGGAAIPRVPRAMPWADIFWSFRPTVG